MTVCEVKYPGSVIPSLAGFLVYQGKTRDIYSLPDYPNLLLVNVTERISTHDVVHISTVPLKDQILNAINIFWRTEVFNEASLCGDDKRYRELMASVEHKPPCDNTKHHDLIAFGQKVYNYPPSDLDYPKNLHLSATVVEACDVVPFELIFRNNLTGSLQRAYDRGEDPYGLRLPSGLKPLHEFSSAIFTPTTKADQDKPVLSDVVRYLMPDVVEMFASLFGKATEYAKRRGIAILDTKFEVGLLRGSDLFEERILDEILTPDSSRYVRVDDLKQCVKEGGDPPWMDKEVFRQQAMRMWGSGAKVPLVFPDSTIVLGVDAYLNLFSLLTGMELEDFQQKYLC
ncbi:MAG: hypothetical protein KC736_02080 [Candidatus Moranbacteria bacterium]|nr:hypothetical protein [Candidatus Moranbacteria bacterium]